MGRAGPEPRQLLCRLPRRTLRARQPRRQLWAGREPWGRMGKLQRPLAASAAAGLDKGGVDPAWERLWPSSATCMAAPPATGAQEGKGGGSKDGGGETGGGGGWLGAAAKLGGGGMAGQGQRRAGAVPDVGQGHLDWCLTSLTRGWPLICNGAMEWGLAVRKARAWPYSGFWWCRTDIGAGLVC